MRYRASYGVSPRHETADLMSIAYLPGNKIGREEGTLASQGGRPGERNKGDSEAPLNLAHARGEQPSTSRSSFTVPSSRPRARGATSISRRGQRVPSISPTRAGSNRKRKGVEKIPPHLAHARGEQHFAKEAKERQKQSKGRGKKGVASLPQPNGGSKARDQAAAEVGVSFQRVS